eukprot:4396308-Ditylum_brightwellii.AAC.1
MVVKALQMVSSLSISATLRQALMARANFNQSHFIVSYEGHERGHQSTVEVFRELEMLNDVCAACSVQRQIFFLISCRAGQSPVSSSIASFQLVVLLFFPKV